MSNLHLVSNYSGIMEHSKWLKEIPYLNFPSDWNVQVSPPFCGAVVRFRVKKEKAEISVYLDCYDNLGIFEAPYWEIYPHFDDTFRCEMSDVESLMKAISESIQQQNAT